MAVRIGANPIGWSNDDMLELGGDTPLETCLAEAREAGFSGMELGNKFPREAFALRSALAPFGLACVSGWWSGSLLTRDAAAELDAMRGHVGLLRAMGCEVVVFAECSNAVHGAMEVPLSRRPVLDDADWREFGRRLTEVGEALAVEGIALAYHHHMGTVVQSRHDIGMLISHTGTAVTLLLDTGHAVWGGSDPAELARTYRERIVHVHAKDVRDAVRRRADEGGWSFLRSVLEGVYTVPGDGGIDYDAVFAALEGYSGWVVVEAEQDPKRAEPLAHARLGYAHLRAVLERTGFEVAA